MSSLCYGKNSLLTRKLTFHTFMLEVVSSCTWKLLCNRSLQHSKCCVTIWLVWCRVRAVQLCALSHERCPFFSQFFFFFGKNKLMAQTRNNDLKTEFNTALLFTLRFCEASTVDGCWNFFFPCCVSKALSRKVSAARRLKIGEVGCTRRGWVEGDGWRGVDQRSLCRAPSPRTASLFAL